MLRVYHGRVPQGMAADGDHFAVLPTRTEELMTELTRLHMHPLTGQVALVTGASSGLGRATALALAQAGADLALLARSESDLLKVAATIETLGRRATQRVPGPPGRLGGCEPDHERRRANHRHVRSD